MMVGCIRVLGLCVCLPFRFAAVRRCSFVLLCRAGLRLALRGAVALQWLCYCFALLCFHVLLLLLLLCCCVVLLLPLHRFAALLLLLCRCFVSRHHHPKKPYPTSVPNPAPWRPQTLARGTLTLRHAGGGCLGEGECLQRSHWAAAAWGECLECSPGAAWRAGPFESGR